MSDKEIHEDLLKVLKQLGKWQNELDFSFDGKLIEYRNDLIDRFIGELELTSDTEKVVVQWTCPICETFQSGDFSRDNGGWLDVCNVCGLNVDLIPM